MRTRYHPATRTHWDIFKTAVGNEPAIIKGSSLSDAILELEGVIAVVEREPADRGFRSAAPPSDVQPTSSKTTSSGDIQISGGYVTIAGATINVNAINLADFIRDSLAVIDEKAESPDQKRAN